MAQTIHQLQNDVTFGVHNIKEEFRIINDGLYTTFNPTKGFPADVSMYSAYVMDHDALIDYENFAFRIVSTVPEPSTYTLMLGGLGMVGFLVARRKKRTSHSK